MRHARFSFALAMLWCLGCASQQIPLFSPTASPVNRLASADEVLIELNGITADLVADGTITQAFVNDTIGPQLDNLRKTSRELHALQQLGDLTPAQLDNFAADLKEIRNRLRLMQRK